MTREEAVAVLEAFIDNPLFSNTHKAVFNIAIHDIKQRHDWDINNLILINKENYEPADREILDKIRTEINQYGSIWVQYTIKGHTDKDIEDIVEDVLKQAKQQMLDLIDKYRNEVSE